MAEEDRLALLRLSQQVEAIAQSLDRISRPDAMEPAPIDPFRRDKRNSAAAPAGGFVTTAG